MNCLVIPDTHIPFERGDFLDFCVQTKKKYKCSKVIHIGDLVDNHAINFHDHDPNGMSPLNEYKKTLKVLKDWYKAFKEVDVVMGNHDELNSRQALKNGIPDVFVKSFKEIWEFPSKWQYYHYIKWQDVLFVHGLGGGSAAPHKNHALKNMCSTVIGHHHTVAGVEWIVNPKTKVFGLSVGCGIDWNKYAFKYQKNIIAKPIIGCGIVFEGGRNAIFEPMEI